MADFFKIDDRAAATRALQTRLRKLSQENTLIPPVFIDGIYGSETEEAVRAFQKSSGLPVTGTVDYNTHRRIGEEYEALLLRSERFVGSPDFSAYEGGVISGGDTFDGVLALQLLFRSIAEQDDRFRLDADGIYGDSTASAVNLFNTLRGNAAAAKVDRLFWNELALFADRYSEN